MKSNLGKQVEANKSLLSQQQVLRTKYDDSIKVNQDVQQRQKDLITEIEQLHGAILQLCPTKQLQRIEDIGRMPLAIAPAVPKQVASPAPTLSSTPPPQMITSRMMSVPTAAARKMGCGFPLNHLRKDDTVRILSTQCTSNDELLNECGICKKCTDQHMLSKCDTCHLYYHLGCLNPPLTRHPKKSKLYAWQCSECDKSDDSAPENVIIPKGPRRSRVRYSKDGPIRPSSLRDSFGSTSSLALSRKSEESHHLPVNGSEIELKPDLKGLEDVKMSEALPASPPPVNEIFVKENVPTTSTPIENKSSAPKKRGRKPKPKVNLPTNDSLAPLDLTSLSMDLSAPPLDLSSSQKSPPAKEPSNGNHIPNNISEQKLIISKMESVEPLSFPELTKASPETPKIAKKGRPRKEKPSIAQISNKLQKKQEINQQEMIELKAEVTVSPQLAEVTLLDLTAKRIERTPIEPYRTFADIPNSIPYPAPQVELPKMADEPETIPVLPLTSSETMLINNFNEELAINGALVNGEGGSSGSGHHKHKKRKSHKRRRSHSPSSGDRAPNGKKHKHKRKHKTHDMDEAPSMGSHSQDSPRLPEQPRIKMKFCAKFVQAGDDKKIMWSLPSTGDEVKLEPYRSSTSVEEIYRNPIEVSNQRKCGLDKELTEFVSVRCNDKSCWQRPFNACKEAKETSKLKCKEGSAVTQYQPEKGRFSSSHCSITF